MALVQEPRPHAGPVGRVREQARHRRRRDFRRRGGAVAASAPARALDHPRVRLDRHLDQFRRVGAVRHIRFPAIGADALVRRGVVNFRALFETRPGRAAMAGGAGLLAARTVRPRPLPALALAPEPRLGMHRPTRAKLRKLRLELPDTGSPGLDLHAQRDDRAPLARIHARRRQQPLQPLRPRRAATAPPAPRGEPPSPRPAPPPACPARSRTAAARTAPWRASRSRRGASSSARRLSRSNSDRQSGSPPPEDGAEGPPPSGKGGPDPSSRTGAGIVRKSCAGTDMRTKITHVERCYQPFAIGPAQMNRNNVLTRRSRENRTLTSRISATVASRSTGRPSPYPRARRWRWSAPRGPARPPPRTS